MLMQGSMLVYKAHLWPELISRAISYLQVPTKSINAGSLSLQLQFVQLHYSSLHKISENGDLLQLGILSPGWLDGSLR